MINVSLRDLHDAAVRKTLLHVPTALTILPGQVRQLRAAGRRAVRESPHSSGCAAAWTSAPAKWRSTPHSCKWHSGVGLEDRYKYAWPTPTSSIQELRHAA